MLLVNKNISRREITVNNLLGAQIFQKNTVGNATNEIMETMASLICHAIEISCFIETSFLLPLDSTTLTLPETRIMLRAFV